MAYLFEVAEKTVYPNTETLLIYPFSDIWERDKSKGKETALRELTYIEFISSMKKSNPYRQYPESRKHEVLVDALGFEEGWKPDLLINEAISKIITFQTTASTTYSYYIAAKKAAEGMKDFFSTPGLLTMTNEKNGNPVYKPRDITSALNDTEKVLANLKSLEKKVEEELFEETKLRSDKQISPFADPKSLNS